MSPTTTPLLSILRRVSDAALFSPRGEPSKASIEAYPILSSRGTLDRRRLSGDARVSATARCRRRTVDCPIVTSLFYFCVAELTDIPFGPCQGFYVATAADSAPASSSSIESKRPKVLQAGDDEFIDRSTGRINFAAVRAAICSAKPVRPEEVETCSRQQQQQRKVDWLVAEKRLKNVTDREEGRAIQYLVLGGYRHYVCDGSPECLQHNDFSLARACSAVHAGPGQQTFGWDKTQRADLLLHFESKSDGSSVLHYHNHHESGTHYSGHYPDCSRADHSECKVKIATLRADSFKRGLAAALTSVRPDRARFVYSITTSCQLEHGNDKEPRVGSTLPASPKRYGRCVDACLSERPSEFVHVSDERRLQSLNVERDILPGIASGSITGFVTVKGGEEAKSSTDSRAGRRFGFCVQKYAPPPGKISPFTKRQIGDYHGYADNEADVEENIRHQAARTVNSGTFHVWETVTTSYLRWLMNARKFVNFEIRHLLVYKFTDDPKHFLEPILQRRHDAKKAGNAVEAECLKLIGNGSFGYNGLEATNYTTVKLLRHASYRAERYKGMAHQLLKSTTLLSMVRQKVKKKKTSKNGDGVTKRRGRPTGLVSTFFNDEAVDDDDDDDDDESQHEEDDDDDEENREYANVLGLELPDGDNPVAVDDDDDDDDEDACDDAAVARQDRKVFGTDPSLVNLSFLYAIDVAGSTRRLFNNLPKAVAVLGNSKRLFLSHLHVMLDCLDPALSELCYIDTDSCLWSLTYQTLEDCLLPGKAGFWKRQNIVADESTELSCHGKLKLEGIYRAALFKTSKIYRLFGDCTTAYTRCKGVNRRQADRLSNVHFDNNFNSATVVHRTCLRPRRTGEIVVTTEAKRLSVPFNLKRFVTDDGIHTLPFSEIHNCDDDDDDDDDDEVVKESSDCEDDDEDY